MAKVAEEHGIFVGPPGTCDINKMTGTLKKEKEIEIDDLLFCDSEEDIIRIDDRDFGHLDI